MEESAAKCDQREDGCKFCIAVSVSFGIVGGGKHDEVDRAMMLLLVLRRRRLWIALCAILMVLGRVGVGAGWGKGEEWVHSTFK